MASSSRPMSRSADSDAPMACSCSSRCTRASAALRPAAEKPSAWVVSRVRLMRSPGGAGSLDADRAHFLDVRDPQQAFLQAVLLQRAHPLLQAHRQYLGHARVLLDQGMSTLKQDGMEKCL